MICTGTETASISAFVRREGCATEMQSTKFLPVASVKVRRVADGGRFKGWYTFSSQLKDGPAAPAEANRTDFVEAVFGLQRLGAAFDLGETGLLVVTTKESHKVELAAFHCFWGNDLASIAIRLLRQPLSMFVWQ